MIDVITLYKIELHFFLSRENKANFIVLLREDKVVLRSSLTIKGTPGDVSQVELYEVTNTWRVICALMIGMQWATRDGATRIINCRWTGHRSYNG